MTGRSTVVSGLTVRFGESGGAAPDAAGGPSSRVVVDGLDLEIPAGRVTGLAGESGSGKSITALAVCGLLPQGAVASGSIRFGDTELLQQSPSAMNALRGTKIAMIFQDPAASFHPMLSIGTQLTDHTRHHLRLNRRQARAHAAELLERVRVPHPSEALRKYPHQFSGGQLQRIAIAGALACGPDLLIADEPTTALDVTVQAGVLRLIRELCDDTGIAVLFITHDLGVMSAIADTVAVMRAGRLVEAGDRRRMLTAPTHEYTRALIDALPVHERPGVPAGRTEGGGVDG